MTKSEKVIKGLECCIPSRDKEERDEERECRHQDCPYEHFMKGNYGCFWELLTDALALLKEQEVKTQGADSRICEICSFYERTLPVKPHYNPRTNWYECGACKFSMTSGMHCKGELIPAYKVGFCAKCGKAVKWNA